MHCMIVLDDGGIPMHASFLLAQEAHMCWPPVQAKVNGDWQCATHHFMEGMAYTHRYKQHLATSTSKHLSLCTA